MELTANQQLAIDIRNSNVLVSAAAGSGKTSVLVERIVKRVSQEDDPIDIDRLLIMTFTNAAAAEMQSRIRDELEAANLERQSLLVHKALITTIHGFCKSVITDHFEKLSLDPSFRVADENECKLIRQDAIDKCLEDAYAKGDTQFLQTAEFFSAGKNDSGLADIIIPLYEFVQADPDPENFMKKCCSAYTCESFEDFAKSPIIRGFEELIATKPAELKKMMSHALDVINDYEALEPYRANIEGFINMLTAMEEDIADGKKCVYETVRDYLINIEIPQLGRINSKKLAASEAEAKDEVKKIRDSVVISLEKLLAIMEFDLKQSYEHVCNLRPVMESLMGIVSSFGEYYAKIKRDKNVIDFSDMEHMAVEILSDPDIAALYRERFAEIYVDEYQDSNLIQEHLVSLICKKDPGNVFQVGDVKQSIYRFRQARPDIFLGKYNTYTDKEGDNRRILLNDNFRSRSQVVNAVNEVFEHIMKADFGGIEYDKNARLNYGATYYDESDDNRYRCELLIGRREELSAEEFEANAIAKRITEMVRDGFPVYDRKAKIIRPATFGDFTILVRSIKKYESTFREVFAGANIPLAVTGREGYFGTIEVQTALAFLAAVDNPLCDIPLATIAKCPVGGFSDRDLATLSAAFGNKICLYERIRAATKPSDVTIDDNLKDKCEKLLKLLNEYKVMSTHTPVHDILSDFIDRHYGDCVKCMSKGSQRMANLSMLLSKAEDYGRTSFTGLYHFNRYMEQIRKYSIDDGEAATVSENDDVVRMMTMHASKGLEFSVCFLAGLEKRRNKRDEDGAIIWSADKGIGIYCADLDRRIMYSTLVKNIVRQDNLREAVAEEMRILYVAMTRAREKLIMVACDKEEEFGSTPKLPERFMSYLDMLKAAYSKGTFRHIDILYLSEEDLVTSRVEEDIRQRSAAEELREAVLDHASDLPEAEEDQTSAEHKDHLANLKFNYPYPLYPDLKAKLSVSELKKRAMEAAKAEDPDMPPTEARPFEFTDTEEKYTPKFMRKEGEKSTGGTFYGTAFHRIMELWDYVGFAAVDSAEDDVNGKCKNRIVTENDVAEFTRKMHDKHRIDKEEADAIRPKDVAYFLNSPLGQRMKAAAAAGALYREQPFVIGVPDRGEMILIQGIIDAYFIEDDGITIVDYKTDRVDSEDTLVNRYRAQLEYYGKALTQITGKPVKVLTIYSTTLRQEIIIE